MSSLSSLTLAWLIDVRLLILWGGKSNNFFLVIKFRFSYSFKNQLFAYNLILNFFWIFFFLFAFVVQFFFLCKYSVIGKNWISCSSSSLHRYYSWAISKVFNWFLFLQTFNSFLQRIFVDSFGYRRKFHFFF